MKQTVDVSKKEV